MAYRGQLHPGEQQLLYAAVQSEEEKAAILL